MIGGHVRLLPPKKKTRMSEPTSSLSRRIGFLAAEMTLVAMCAALVGCDLAAVCVSQLSDMTSRRTICPNLRQAAMDHACRLPACSGGLASVPLPLTIASALSGQV